MKTVPWLEAMLCGVPWWWAHHLCASVNISLGRSIMWRKGNPIPTQESLPKENVPQWKCSNMVNLSLGCWLITSENGATLGLSAGLWCWQIWHSVDTVRSALVSKTPCCRAHVYMHSSHPCQYGHCCSWAAPGRVRKRGWLLSTEWVTHLFY